MPQTDDKIHSEKVRTQLGDQGMEPREAKSQMAHDSYKVIAFTGPSLPKEYQNMVFSKWMRRLRQGNEYFKLVDSECFYSAYHRYIAHLLSRPLCVVRIAALTEDPDVALGFSVSEQKTLHFVITFNDYRRMGIGRSLVPFEVETITHLTKMGMMLWSQKLPKAIFNPFFS